MIYEPRVIDTVALLAEERLNEDLYAAHEEYRLRLYDAKRQLMRDLEDAHDRFWKH